MAIVVVLDWTLKTIRARILDSLSCAVDQRLSQQVFEHLLHVQLDAQPRTLGTLAAQVGSLEAVRQFFSATVVFALVDLPFALMFLAFIGIIGGAVAWVYARCCRWRCCWAWSRQWRLRGLLRGQLSRSNERQGLLVDSIRGAESIRANNAGWRFARRVAGDHRQHRPLRDTAARHQQFCPRSRPAVSRRSRMSRRWWSVSGRSKRAC